MGLSIRLYFWRILTNTIASSRLVPQPIRYFLYRLAGIKTATMNIRPGCRIKFPLVTIGGGTFINDNCAFENFASVEIGKNCSIAPEVMFCTTTHEQGDEFRRAGHVIGKPIRVGDGCWIGARALILSGVTIGDGSVIAAGAVVISDCEPHGIYTGVPARRVKDLPASPKLPK